MRFLVVEDVSIMRRIISNALKNLGFEELVEAEDGEDALAKLHSEKVDFVITDWLMPNMSGLELAQAIRADENLKNLPILMITMRDTKADLINAIKAEVNGYIVKPFTTYILQAKIQEIIRNQKNLTTSE